MIDPRDEKSYWSGSFEPRVQDAIAKHLAPGSVMWDVGAHIGFMSAIAVKAVGPAGRVVAFEPLPKNIDRLRHTVHANGIANLTIRPVAVSSSVGSRAFYIHDSSSMGGLLHKANALRIDVPTTTLDAELDVSRPPTLVKIDVEGCEDEVIAGGRHLFNAIRPVIIIELLSEDAAARARALLRHYDFHHIDDSNFIAEPTP